MSATWHQLSDEDWQEVAPTDPETVMSIELTDRHHTKQGRSIVRWTLGGGRLVVYLKRHFRESAWAARFARLTGRPNWSAAWQEFEHLKWAASVGLPVPRAVAVGTKVGKGNLLQGFLAIEELAGKQALHELIPRAFAALPPTQFRLWKRAVVLELARMAKLLHSHRRFHQDLYLCHFFAPQRFPSCEPKDLREQIAVIDLHRMAHRNWFWRWWQLKDLAQLLYSSDVIGVTARDRVRFWRHYAGKHRNYGIGPWLRRLILIRWKNYRGHNSARRTAA